MFDIENCSTCQAILSCGANLIVMWSNFDSHDKQNCHEKQNCSTWKVLLTDNVCGVCDKYDVREDTLTNVDISQGFKIGNKQEKLAMERTTTNAQRRKPLTNLNLRILPN